MSNRFPSGRIVWGGQDPTPRESGPSESGRRESAGAITEGALQVTGRQFALGLIVSISLVCGLLVAVGCGTVKVEKIESKASASSAAAATKAKAPRTDIVRHTEDEWRALLTPEQFRVLRKEGTEVAFTGAYWKTHTDGTYLCAACALPLFGSAEKFDSGTGWPSYWQPLDPNAVDLREEHGFGSTYSEVHCARCGGHLGHVFNDGPRPTGLRYCINSVSLTFQPNATK